MVDESFLISQMKQNPKKLIQQIFVAGIVLCTYLGILSCERHVRYENGIDRFRIYSEDSVEIRKILLGETWVAPDTASLLNNKDGRLIKYGRELIIRTGAYLGPNGSVSKAANGMNCQNCHLNGGTKLWANTYSGVFANYPRLRPRSGTVEDLEKRINDCMQRSMNGSALDPKSLEMKAMIAYIEWVGHDVEKGKQPVGVSIDRVPWLDRPADPLKGRSAFRKNCMTCHGEQGQGKFNLDETTYQYPPLWGPHSYTTAAGMYRLTKLSGFIKSNMPYLLSSHDTPVLTDEEAWDIAAFINSMPRPHRTFIGDWPVMTQKPIDHPFGPYGDPFSEEQHKYGPFPLMMNVPN